MVPFLSLAENANLQRSVLEALQYVVLSKEILVSQLIR